MGISKWKNPRRLANGALLLALNAALALAGCATTQSSAPESTGAAGGSTSAGGDANVKTCTEPVGTVRLQDGMASASTAQRQQGGNQNLAQLISVLNGLQTLSGGGQNQAAASGQAGGSGGASLDSLRLLIQQSNCFLIVDRGLAAEQAADDEKRRTRTSNEVRDDANMGEGQEAAADYVLRSSVISLETKESRGLNLGFISKVVGGGSGGQTVSEAKVQLVLSDIRSKLQVAVAQGEGSGSNTRLAATVLGAAGRSIGGAGVSSESKTSSTTILLQAFADAYNKMVPAVQNYKMQTVKGGAGAGGTLKVQGSRSDPSALPPSVQK